MRARSGKPYRLIVSKPRRNRAARETQENPDKPSATPQLPDLVDEVAHEAFRQIVPVLQGKGKLSHGDLESVQHWCNTWSLLALAEWDVRSRGSTVLENEVQYDHEGIKVEESSVTLNPSLTGMRDACEQIDTLGTKLGLSPVELACLKDVMQDHLTQRQPSDADES